MHIRPLVLVLLFTVPTYADESLSRPDFIGNWEQSHPITEGETSSLSITQDFSVKFSRSFAGTHPDQTFSTEAGGLRFVDDLAIIELHSDNGGIAYKLVLSSWRVREERMVFGTMYMYRDEKLFNGLPISFRIEG